jgi:hypothetical protein
MVDKRKNGWYTKGEICRFHEEYFKMIAFHPTHQLRLDPTLFSLQRASRMGGAFAMCGKCDVWKERGTIIRPLRGQLPPRGRYLAGTFSPRTM